jgi:hypothetical protein
MTKPLLLTAALLSIACGRDVDISLRSDKNMNTKTDDEQSAPSTGDTVYGDKIYGDKIGGRSTTTTIISGEVVEVTVKEGGSNDRRRTPTIRREIKVGGKVIKDYVGGDRIKGPVLVIDGKKIYGKELEKYAETMAAAKKTVQDAKVQAAAAKAQARAVRDLLK